jgi:hypothetical protein
VTEDYSRGHRHGEDGVAYHPGPRCQDPAGYRRGYQAGREHYRAVTGRHPPTGDASRDQPPSPRRAT